MAAGTGKGAPPLPRQAVPGPARSLGNGGAGSLRRGRAGPATAEESPNIDTPGPSDGLHMAEGSPSGDRQDSDTGLDLSEGSLSLDELKAGLDMAEGSPSPEEPSAGLDMAEGSPRPNPQVRQRG